MVDWDDLRFVLEVARQQSAGGAGRALGVNPTTVTRRLARLEEQIGEDLFDRRQTGYRLTEMGRRVAAAAEEMQKVVLGLQDQVAASRRALKGVVRLTCAEIIAAHLVAPWLTEFRRLHPEVRIELNISDALLDLAKGQADVALRVGATPEGSGIVARRLPSRTWSVYCSRSYDREKGAPQTPEAIIGHAIIGMEGDMARLPSWRWMEQLVGPAAVDFRCNSLSNVVSNAKAGMGLAMLPSFVGDREPELIRCLPLIPELDAEFWLIVNETMKSTPHIRAFVDFLAERVHADERVTKRSPSPPAVPPQA